jgi:hypothetical protein
MVLRQNVVLPNYGAKHSRRNGNLSLAVTLAFLVKHEAHSIQ